MQDSMQPSPNEAEKMLHKKRRMWVKSGLSLEP
jgi:hypothetical protein